jgi:hypothetical protein
MCKMSIANRKGQSRMDVLVVIAIIILGLGVLLPFTQQAGVTSGDNFQTRNNLQQCAFATHAAHDQFKHYPPFWGYYGAFKADNNPNPQASFFVHLLPYVEQGPLYTTCQFDPDTANMAASPVPAYLAPTDYTQVNYGVGSVSFAVNLRLWQSAGRTNVQPPLIDQYEAVGQPLKVRMRKTFEPDGTSYTLLFATKMQVCGANASTLINGRPTFIPADPTSGTVTEVATINGPYFGWTHATPANQALASANLGWQPAPSSSTCIANASLAQSFHPQAIQVAMCDGHTRSVVASISFDAWTKALTPNGREVPPTEWFD